MTQKYLHLSSYWVLFLFHHDIFQKLKYRLWHLGFLISFLASWLTLEWILEHLQSTAHMWFCDSCSRESESQNDHLPVQVTHTWKWGVFIWGVPGLETYRQLKRSRTSEMKEQDDRGCGPVAPSASCRRQSLGKCHRRQPCRQGINYRLDSQVTITWVGSLSLPLFSFCSCVSCLSRLYLPLTMQLSIYIASYVNTIKRNLYVRMMISNHVLPTLFQHWVCDILFFVQIFHNWMFSQFGG